MSRQDGYDRSGVPLLMVAFARHAGATDRPSIDQSENARHLHTIAPFEVHRHCLGPKHFIFNYWNIVEARDRWSALNPVVLSFERAASFQGARSLACFINMRTFFSWLREVLTNETLAIRRQGQEQAQRDSCRINLRRRSFIASQIARSSLIGEPVTGRSTGTISSSRSRQIRIKEVKPCRQKPLNKYPACSAITWPWAIWSHCSVSTTQIWFF